MASTLKSLEDKDFRRSLEVKDFRRSLEVKDFRRSLEDKGFRRSLEDKGFRRSLEDKGFQRSLEDKGFQRSLARIEKHRDAITRSAIADTLRRKRVFQCKYKVGKINTEVDSLRELKAFLLVRSRRVCLADVSVISPEDERPKFYDFGGFSDDEY
jgi:hypothetical protein